MRITPLILFSILSLTLSACDPKPELQEISRPTLDIDPNITDDSFTPLRAAQLGTQGAWVCTPAAGSRMSQCSKSGDGETTSNEPIPQEAASILESVRSGNTTIQD
jgi:hypothetical protein